MTRDGDVLVIQADRPTHIGLFAVGRGGNPTRHLPLLQSLAARGCTIIAPHSEMLPSPIPTKAELDARIRGLETALDAEARTDLPLVGIGHSIGTVALLALAGGQAVTLAGERVTSGSKWTFTRLALLAPATDFFRRPGALKAVKVPMRVWAGAQDTITPPAQALFLREALAGQTSVDVVIDEMAGHFTYMDELPPRITDPHPDRRGFLTSLAGAAGQFLMG